MNYPNMSYCAFENTNSAIRQLIDIMSDALDERVTGEEFIEECSSWEEKTAVKQLKMNMKTLLQIYDNLEI